MSLLIFSLRRQQIVALKNSLNFKLLNLNQRMMDLQTYAASIADGSVTPNDLMSAPASLFGRMTAYMNYSHQYAMAGAQNKFGQFMIMNQANYAQVPDEFKQQYQQIMFKGLYEQERAQAAEVEKKLLNVEEKKIEQEVLRIQTQLKMLDSEQEQVSKSEDDAAKKSAPQYVA